MTFLKNTIACDNFAAYVEIMLSQMIVERGIIQREMTHLLDYNWPCILKKTRLEILPNFLYDQQL